MATLTAQVGAITVQRFQVIGTPVLVHEAWEAYNGHSSTTHIDGVRMGKVTSRPLTAELDALPIRSLARLEAVQAFYRDLYREAYAAIVAAFPEAADGRFSHGEITTEAVS